MPIVYVARFQLPNGGRRVEEVGRGITRDERHAKEMAEARARQRGWKLLGVSRTWSPYRAIW